MSSIFLSYGREDLKPAKSIALALEKAGHSVWWDRHIKGGAQYGKEIEDALRSAEVVVVLWSKHSIGSAWVRDEAAAGRDTERLVPVGLDEADPPLGFRQYQTIDLSAWKGRGRAPEVQTLLEAVEAMAAKAPPVETPASVEVDRAPGPPRRRLLVVAGSVTVALLAAIALFWLAPWASKSSIPIVQVSAAESSGPSQALARDLLVKLGQIQTTRPGLMTLVDDREGGRTPDLILEIGATEVDQQANAGLALRDGKRAGLLWSKDFQQANANEADLRQQVASTAARVLGCALEGISTPGQQLKSETQKVYLNACAQLLEIGPDGPEQVIPALLRVVRDNPAFKPGWAKLLMAEADAGRARSAGKVDAGARKLLRQHIDTARQLDPAMPEAMLAEISLLPVDDFAQAEKIADSAKQLDPDSLAVLNVRSDLLLAVGRMNEGIEEAQRAAELDPLSPQTHSSYVLALAYGGRIESAREELRRAERLWRGTDTLRGLQYAFHLRFGDPRQALQLRPSIPEGFRLYLEARANPSPENVDQLVAYGNSRPRLAAQRGNGGGYLSFIVPAYGEFGRHDDLFRGAMEWPRSIDLGSVSYMLFRPALKSFRREPRFMQVAHRAGLIDYWRKSGKWPDFCFEPDMPYDCKSEAAKLS